MLDAFAKVALAASRGDEGSMQKTARIWSRPGVAMSGPDSADLPWSEKFRGSPFHKEATELDKGKADRDVEYAQQRIEDAKEQLEDAKFRSKIAQVEKKLVDWTYSQDGKEKQALAEKLAECRHRSFQDWSDYFTKSPFYKEAMQLEAEDAQREVGRRERGLEMQQKWFNDERISVKRAEIEAKHAVWRLEQMGFSKTASLHLAAHQHTSENTMISEITAEAFFHEMDEIEKHARVSTGRERRDGAYAAGGLALGTAGGVAHGIYTRRDPAKWAEKLTPEAKDVLRKVLSKTASASAMVSRRAALGIGGAATAAAGTAGVVGGHKKGRKTGRREGYHVGSRHGFQVGARKGYTAGQIAMIKRLRAAQMARAQAQAAAKRKK
jgi:hypothetical protein